jgi:hypothetical protein
MIFKKIQRRGLLAGHVRAIVRNLLVLNALIFSLFILNAYAEDAEGDNFKNEVDSYVRYISSSPDKAQPGKVEIIQSEVNYSYNLKLFGELPVKLAVNPEYISINRSVATKLPAHLTSFTADIETTFPFFNLKQTYFRIGLSPSFNGDNWDFNSSDLRIPSRYYAIYQLNEKWTFVCGVAVFPNYENTILPIAGFIYKPNDKLLFNFTPDRPNISYALTDRFTLFVEADGSIEEYVVTRDGQENVKLRYTQAHLGSGVRFKINKFTETSLSVGGVLDHTLRYRDTGGKVSIKDGFYVEFRIEARI